MKNNDLNILIGLNLRRLRLERSLTQDQLADRLQVSTGLITKWEAGRKGIGKRLLLKLCKSLNVKPCLFYVDKNTPYITSSRERDIVCMLREAEKAGVVEMIEQFTQFIVNQAKNKRRTVSKGKATQSESSCARRRGSAELGESPV